MKKFCLTKGIKCFVSSILTVALLVALRVGTAEASEKVKLRLAVSPSPHAEIANLIKDRLEKEGVDLEIVEFTDYETPNLALEEGDVDANYFQHIPYFDDFTAKNDLHLEILCGVHIEPMGVYSSKYKSIEEIEEGAEVFIPDDTVNGARALLLLEAKGLIKLDEKAGLDATEKDIKDNPKNLKFKALEAATIPQTYEDAGLAVINGNYAIQNGLNPLKDTILLEDSQSPYTNIVAVRAGDKDKDEFKKLKEALQDELIKDFIEKKYEGAVVYAAYDPDKEQEASEEAESEADKTETARSK